MWPRACASPVSACAALLLVYAHAWKEVAGARRRVAAPTGTFPLANDRSVGEDSGGGAAWPFRSSEVHVLDFKRCGSAGAGDQYCESSLRRMVACAISDGGFPP